MLAFAKVVGIVAERLASPVPAANEQGDYAFELADGMRLGLRPLPDDRLAAWAEIDQARPGETPEETEGRAAWLLRVHMARLHRAGGSMPTMDESGAFLMYRKLLPESERDLIDELAALLNETEAVRRIRDGGGRSAPFPGTGMFSLP